MVNLKWFVIFSWRRVPSKDGSTAIIHEYIYDILEGFYLELLFFMSLLIMQHSWGLGEGVCWIEYSYVSDVMYCNYYYREGILESELSKLEMLLWLM